jgi:hypothetical protein
VETPVFYRFLRQLDEAWASERALAADDIRLMNFVSADQFDAFMRTLPDLVLESIGSRKPGAEVVMDKTPNNTLDWRLIRRLYPDALFLHVVRDPRDVVCSLRTASIGFARDWAPRRIATGTLFWRHYIEQGQRSAESGHRYREVRYEELLARGEVELAAIFDWLGLDSREVDLPAIIQSNRSNTARPPGAWRKDLAPGQVRTIEHLAAGHMEALGYERSMPPGRPLGAYVDKVRRKTLAAVQDIANRLARVERWLGQ